MSARDEAIKAALAKLQNVRWEDLSPYLAVTYGLDAAHDAGLIVWADDLRAERFRLSEDVIANHEPLVHSEQEIVNEWRASWWDEGSSPIPGTDS